MPSKKKKLICTTMHLASMSMSCFIINFDIKRNKHSSKVHLIYVSRNKVDNKLLKQVQL